MMVTLCRFPLSHLATALSSNASGLQTCSFYSSSASTLPEASFHQLTFLLWQGKVLNLPYALWFQNSASFSISSHCQIFRVQITKLVKLSVPTCLLVFRRLHWTVLRVLIEYFISCCSCSKELSLCACVVSPHTRQAPLTPSLSPWPKASRLWTPFPPDSKPPTWVLLSGVTFLPSDKQHLVQKGTLCRIPLCVY